MRESKRGRERERMWVNERNKVRVRERCLQNRNFSPGSPQINDKKKDIQNIDRHKRDIRQIFTKFMGSI